VRVQDGLSATELSASVRGELEQIGRRLAGARNAIAFSGAGISTESGLPDYRGSNGLWKNQRFEELAHIETFLREPAVFWRFYAERLVVLRGAAPNPAHFALARLEQEGLLLGLITQNVDGLHHAAGSRIVAEIHGSLREGECLACRAVVESEREPAGSGERSRLEGGFWEDDTWISSPRLPMAEVEARLAAAPDGVPRCACGGPLKPAVVLFGETLPRRAITRALGLARHADYLLCLGTSLQVSPASAIPEIVLQNSGKVAIINQGETDYDDEPAVHKVEAPLALAMPIVLQAALAARALR
jgi:NAD-dependent deacetylase